MGDTIPAPRCDADPERSSSMSSDMLSERHGNVLVLTLSDPATRNTLSEQAINGGIEALATAESDATIRCVILRGDGGHFCAGGNINGLQQRRQAGPPAQASMLERLNQLVEAMRACPKPLIAAVEGAAAGAGFALALACDLIVAAQDARFVLSYARLGLTPDGGASWHLARALPRGLVQQMVWLADPVPATQLAQWGVVQQLAGNGEAFARALELAGRLAAMAPNALAGAKELVEQAPTRTLAEQLAAERDQFIRNLFDANGGEGLQAFLEKRAPSFR